MRPRPLWLAMLAFLAVLALARNGRAQEDFDDAERFLDRGLDVDDLARMPAMPRPGGGRVMAGTWLSLGVFTRSFASGVHDFGVMGVLGVALDRIAQGRERAGPTPSYADDAGAPAPAAARPSPPEPPRLVLDMGLARAAVRAAWRFSGVEVNDARIDDMICRSRLSALLPEARMRVVRMSQDAEHATTYVNEAGTVVDTLGSTLTLEARLTWRFDRLLYADDEGSLERLRLEREDARSRVGSRVLELLFVWQRALLDAASAESGSRAELDASLRRYEAEVTLDILTGGWFGSQPLVRDAPGLHARASPPPRQSR